MLSIVLVANNAGFSYADGITEERYELLSGNKVEVNNILENSTSQLNLEGNTVINLLGSKASISNNSDNVVSIDKESNLFIFNKVNVSAEETNNPSIYFHDAMVEVNKTYTLIFDIVENTLKNTNHSNVGKFNLVNYSAGNHYIKDSDIGIQKVVLSQPGTITHSGHPYIEIYKSTVGRLVVKDIMILEGDWSDKDISSYFTEMTSGFESQLVTQEMIDNGQEDIKNLNKYKVEIKSVGKNKFSGYEKFIEVQPNKMYYISGHTNTPENRVKFRAYDKDFNEITGPNCMTVLGSFYYADWYYGFMMYGSNMSVIESKMSFAEDVKYIKFNNDAFIDFQLEEGSVKTSYEEYKDDEKITIYLNSPLLKEDTIENINGNLYHVHRYISKDITYTEKDNWHIQEKSNNIETLLFTMPSSIKNATGFGGELLSNKFLSVDYLWTEDLDKDIEAIDIAGDESNDKNLHIRIKKNRLKSQTLAGFKEWIENNPLKIVYKLKEPVYELLEGSNDITLSKGTIMVSNNSLVPINITIKVDRILNKIEDSIKVAKANPTPQNLARARMWINLLEESTLKDELQDEVNDIIDLEDLEIDKKSVSANMDVYIRNENVLSMSLSTNSVTFDNYSAVEDSEKLNAVELNIHSSLPYTLNSYLEGPIRNSDGTATIDSTALNIKEQGLGEYKAFSSATNKIILNESVEAGNNNRHKIDLKISKDKADKADVYKATIKFEAIQK